MGSLGGKEKELSRQSSGAIAPVSSEHSELAAGHGSALGSAQQVPPRDSQALAMAAGGGAARVWVPCWLSRGSCSRPV